MPYMNQDMSDLEALLQECHRQAQQLVRNIQTAQEIIHPDAQGLQQMSGDDTSKREGQASSATTEQLSLLYQRRSKITFRNMRQISELLFDRQSSSDSCQQDHKATRALKCVLEHAALSGPCSIELLPLRMVSHALKDCFAAVQTTVCVQEVAGETTPAALEQRHSSWNAGAVHTIILHLKPTITSLLHVNTISSRLYRSAAHGVVRLRHVAFHRSSCDVTFPAVQSLVHFFCLQYKHSPSVVQQLWSVPGVNLLALDAGDFQFHVQLGARDIDGSYIRRIQTILSTNDIDSLLLSQVKKFPEDGAPCFSRVRNKLCLQSCRFTQTDFRHFVRHTSRPWEVFQLEMPVNMTYTDLQLLLYNTQVSVQTLRFCDNVTLDVCYKFLQLATRTAESAFQSGVKNHKLHLVLIVDMTAQEITLMDQLALYLQGYPCNSNTTVHLYFRIQMYNERNKVGDIPSAQVQEAMMQGLANLLQCHDDSHLVCAVYERTIPKPMAARLAQVLYDALPYSAVLRSVRSKGYTLDSQRIKSVDFGGPFPHNAPGMEIIGLIQTKSLDWASYMVTERRLTLQQTQAQSMLDTCI